MSESGWDTVTKKKPTASPKSKEAVTTAQRQTTSQSDWDTVTVLRKNRKTAPPNSKEAITAAQRRGVEIETTKKYAAGENKQHIVTKNTAILDGESEELRHQKVPLEVGKVIQRGRQEKGLSQKDLSTKINEKAQVIAEYESGKAIPNNQVMGKIERVIGLKLRGKDIGQPLDPIKSKK